MNAFISAIYINTNNTSSEKVCVGLIAVTENKVFFEKSEAKLKTAIHLLKKEEITNSIKNSLKLISKHISEYNAEIAENKLFKNNFLSKEHFGYLNNYSQGVIQFMEPKPFAGPIAQQDFKKLFELFVGDTLTTVKHETNKTASLKTKVDSFLKKEVFKSVDIHYSVPAGKVPFVKAETTVDVIYKNGTFISANTIDFNASPDTILKHYNEYLVLSLGLYKLAEENKLDEPSNKIIAEAPLKGTSQEEIYQSIKEEKGSPLDIVTPNYLDELEKKINSESHQKFSEYLVTL